MQIEKYIADKITSLCEKRDISKYRLSQLSGISQSSLGRIMAQENLPSLITLEKICTALGVTLSQLFQEGPAVDGAGAVLAQEVVVEPGAQEAGFVLVLFDHERTARRVVEHLLVVADVLDEVGGRTDAAVEVAPEFVVVRRGAPIAEVYLVGVVVLAVVGDVQIVRAGIPRNGARAMGFVQNVAVNGGEVFLRIGSALEDLFDGDSVVGHLIEEVVVAGGQAGGRSQREQCYFEFHG